MHVFLLTYLLNCYMGTVEKQTGGRHESVSSQATTRLKELGYQSGLNNCPVGMLDSLSVRQT